MKLSPRIIILVIIGIQTMIAGPLFGRGLSTVGAQIPIAATGAYDWSAVKKAEYRLESGALGTDSSGNAQTLTNSGTADTTNYKQGSASITYNGTTQYSYRDDADLMAGFPGKSSTGYQNFLIMGWVRSTNATAAQTLWGKYESSTGRRSWELNTNSAQLRTYISATGSAATKNYTLSTVTMATNQWYHVCQWHDYTLGKWGIRVWDDSAATVYNYSEAYTSGMYLSSSSPFNIGARSATGFLVGNLDQVVVYGWTDGANPTETQITDKCDAVRGGTAP